MTTPHWQTDILVGANRCGAVFWLSRMNLTFVGATVEFLESDGLIIYAAQSADDAIPMMEAYPEIDVLFTDIEMPGKLDGLQLAHFTYERWPDKSIFIVSGRGMPRRETLPVGSKFLVKPYAILGLADRMRAS